jgi:hypothetical protein
MSVHTHNITTALKARFEGPQPDMDIKIDLCRFIKNA